MTATFNPRPHGRHGEPGRCWRLKARDRLAWRLFSIVAHRDVSDVTWDCFIRTCEALVTTWRFEDGMCSMRRIDVADTQGERLEEAS